MKKIITLVTAAFVAIAFAVPVTFGADKAPIVDHSVNAHKHAHKHVKKHVHHVKHVHHAKPAKKHKHV